MKTNKCNLTGKTIFDSLSSAKASMFGFSFRHWDSVTLQRRNRRAKKKEQKRAYYCEGCEGYHLTSQEHYVEEFKTNKRR